MRVTVVAVRELLSKLRDDDEFDRSLGLINQSVMRGNDTDGWVQVGYIDLVNGTLDLYGEGIWDVAETGLVFTPSEGGSA